MEDCGAVRSLQNYKSPLRPVIHAIGDKGAGHNGFGFPLQPSQNFERGQDQGPQKQAAVLHNRSLREPAVALWDRLCRNIRSYVWSRKEGGLRHYPM